MTRLSCLLLLLAMPVARSAVMHPARATESMDGGSQAHLAEQLRAKPSTNARDRLSALQRQRSLRNAQSSTDSKMKERTSVELEKGSHRGIKDDLRGLDQEQRQEIIDRHEEKLAAARLKAPLSKSQLRDIYSIRCLQEKQKDPRYHCVSPEELQAWHSNWVNEINIGTYPKSYTDPQCNSHGEFLCDPNWLLEEKDAKEIAMRLQNFKMDTAVTCANNDDSTDPFVSDHSRRNFNLAVVIADEWPSEEADAGSLQKFGLVVMNQWGLMSMYNGVDTESSVDNHFTWNEYYKNCPNSAVLIVLPRYNEVFLSSPSCEFICATRGGPEVKYLAELALQRDGLSAAIKVAIEKVGQALAATTPLSLQKSYEAKQKREDREKLMQARLDREVLWGQRLILFLIWVMLVVCVTGMLWSFTRPREKAFGTIERADRKSVV